MSILEKEKKSQINCFIFYLKTPEKEEQNKLKTSRKEIVKDF